MWYFNEAVDKRKKLNQRINRWYGDYQIKIPVNLLTVLFWKWAVLIQDECVVINQVNLIAVRLKNKPKKRLMEGGIS